MCTGLIAASVYNAQPNYDKHRRKRMLEWTDFFRDDKTMTTKDGNLLNSTTKVRMRQLASFWQQRRDRDAHKVVN
jgi:hypothetical protein